MPNRQYKRGRALEYLMKDKLEKQGYFVVRAAGSHGVADIMAIKSYSAGHEILFVSCKIPQYAPPAERRALVEAAVRCGAIPMMTVKDKAGTWKLERVEA
jgi:Holliday junction resolvase